MFNTSGMNWESLGRTGKDRPGTGNNRDGTGNNRDGTLARGPIQTPAELRQCPGCRPWCPGECRQSPGIATVNWRSAGMPPAFTGAPPGHYRRQL
ncbi:hypothetical protein DPMN_000114 [Dreissena polymorpha]|uniref:Uncharacterized protein n=1 Tax=Dreissena polymorpha TaxID=45954 RepID=A0A9D4MF79_DREPO|nr:hypothetical protein DPMN_000114 [Dreissena polymorpha]